MVSAAEKSTPPGRVNGITLTRTLFSTGVRLENEAEEALANRRPTRSRARAHSPFSATVAVLYLTCFIRPVNSGEAAKGPPTDDQPGRSDILLFERLVKVISRNRLAMNIQSNSGSDTTTRNIPYDPNVQPVNSTLRDKLLELMQKYDNMRPRQSAAVDWIDGLVTMPAIPDGEHVDECPSASHCDAWKAVVFQYLFPWVLCLAILGNALTLAVYRSRYLKGAASVLLLAVKAQANLAFACSLSMEMLHYFVVDDQIFQDIYWRSRPYTLFLANYFDSLAVWCTLVITLETYICITFPLHFRRWFSRRTIYIVIISLMVGSGLLHVAYPITREVERLASCPLQYRYKMVIRDGWMYYDYERVYFVLHALAVICLPALLMAIFSILIGYNFNRKAMGHRFSERRRCVLSITFTTTLCSLVLQAPGLVVFASAAIRGSNLENNFSFCTMNVVTNFLTILNSAAPFLVYLCLNDTFRRLLFVQLGSRFSLCPIGRPWCRRTYETGIGRVPLRELTEPEPSHFALAQESNFNTLRSASAIGIDEESGLRDQNRLAVNGSPGRIVSAADGKHGLRNSPPQLTRVQMGKCAETFKIIVEEVS